MVATFVLSVALQAGIELLAAEADTFAFIARLLEVRRDTLTRKDTDLFDDFRSWLEPPLKGLRVATGALGVLVQERKPQLASHLAREGAGIELLSLSWFQTLFTCLAPLPRHSLCRIWECWLLDGTPKVFFRLALALLAQTERTLMKLPLEQLAETLQKFPPPHDGVLEADKIISVSWSTKVTNKVMRRVLATSKATI